jgi:outer membrane protein
MDLDKEHQMIVAVRRLLTSLAVLTAAGTTTATAQQPQGGSVAGARIAFVNAGQILRQMPGYARAESLWTREARTAEQEAQKLRAPFDSAVAAFQQSSAMMTPTNRTAKERSLRAQSDTLQQRLQALEQRVDARERELLTPMQQRLSAVIEGIRAESNYWFVVDLGNQASAAVIVSYDKALDITDRVLRRLQQSSN